MLSGDIAKLFLWYYVGFFIIFARIYQKHHAAGLHIFWATDSYAGLEAGFRWGLRRWLPSETAEPDHFDGLYTDFIANKTKTHHILRTNIFERLEIFHEVKESDDDIALQLYDKYVLTDDERQFIETHVKAME